jgi:hypothetical protein
MTLLVLTRKYIPLAPLAPLALPLLCAPTLLATVKADANYIVTLKEQRSGSVD